MELNTDKIRHCQQKPAKDRGLGLSFTFQQDSKQTDTKREKNNINVLFSPSSLIHGPLYIGLLHKIPIKITEVYGCVVTNCFNTCC